MDVQARRLRIWRRLAGRLLHGANAVSVTQTLKAGHMVRPPSLRRASFDDYEQIAAVEAANGLLPKDREQWLHLWQNNPAYQQLSGWPIGWVLEDNGHIVGALDNIPTLCRFGGRTYVAAFGRGWAVDAVHRPYAILLLMSQRKQPNVDLLITSTAGARTLAVLTALGWSRVPVGTWDRSAFWITNYSETIPRYLAGRMPRLASALTPLLYAPLLLKDFVAAYPRELKTGCKLDWCAGFDARFDQFWAELERQNPDLLLSVRDRQTLNWHFTHALAQGRIWILTACRGPRLLAYAIFERRETPGFDLTRLFLVDFQMLVKDARLVSAMISLALARCRKEGIHALENLGCWLQETQPLGNRPPYRRNLMNWGYLYYPINPELANALRYAEPWYPTLYDADASL
jgi:hypothetical protein